MFQVDQKKKWCLKESSFPDVFEYFHTCVSTVYLLGRGEFLVQPAEHSIQVFDSARAGQ